MQTSGVSGVSSVYTTTPNHFTKPHATSAGNGTIGLVDLLDILEKFEHEKDPFSSILNQWSSAYIRLEGSENTDLLDQLRSLLLNPFSAKKSLISESMLDEDGWLWEKDALLDYQALLIKLGMPNLSPFTENPLTAQSHPFASAMSEWLLKIENCYSLNPCNYSQKNRKKKDPLTGELIRFDGEPSENSSEVLSLKLLLYKSKAKTAVCRKKYKKVEQPLWNSIARTNQSVVGLHGFFAKVAEESQKYEKRRSELTEEQISMLKQTLDSTSEQHQKELAEARETLKQTLEALAKLQETIAELEKQRAASAAEQARINAANKAGMEERLQGVEHIYKESNAINEAKINEVNKNVGWLKENSKLQEENIAKLSALIDQYMAEIRQLRDNASQQEMQVRRLHTRIKHLQLWPF